MPCLRRKYGGNLAAVLSFCAPSEEDSGGNGGAGNDGAPVLSPIQVAQVLADRAMALAPAPKIRVAPARVGLTGLDSYFWLDPPDLITASAGVGGLVVTAEARPVQSVWDFGDGNDLVTSHPGQPWSERRPGNISHMYESDGRYTLTLEQIWEARWQLGGGPWQSLGFFSNSADRPYPVRQVVPVLVPSADIP